MVKTGSTKETGNDTGFVLLENFSVSLNCNRDWCLGNGRHQLIRIIFGNCHMVISIDFSFSINDRIVTSSIFASIWIVIFLDELIVFQVFKRFRWETTFTSIISILRCRSAINKLLFRKAQKFSCVNSMRSLHSSSGGKGPARTAASLVFDGTNCFLITPVNRVAIRSFKVGDIFCNSC